MKAILVFAVCVACASSATTTSNLLSVIQVFRHGLRAPLFFYPTDPHSDSSYWSVEGGQLDNTGKKQHYALGKFTRARYSDLMSVTYNSTRFYAYTTDVDRTHMSVQANLAALWEPSGKQIWNENLNWQPIPVHPIDTRILHSYYACGKFLTLYSDVIGNADFFATINEEYIDVFKTVTDNSGYVVSSVAGIATVYDTLLIEELNGFTLPDWTSSVYPEPMKTLTAYNWMGFTFTDLQKKISTGIFFRDMIKHFDAIVANPTAAHYQFKMYSGHDINIAAVLDTLGAFTPHSPYFASTIYFELRELNGKYFVNTWHKNQDTFEQITVKGCTLNCNLSLFKVLLANYVLDEDEFDTLCSTDSSSTSTYALSLTDPGIRDNVKYFLQHRGPRNSTS